MAKRKLTPYQRIMRNAEKDRGVVLTADEVYELSQDDAIATRAVLEDEANATDCSDKEEKQP